MKDNRFSTYPKKIADSVRHRTSIVDSGVMIAVMDQKLIVRNYGARHDEPAYVSIDPNDYWLPKAPFTEGPVRLTTRPDLVAALFDSLQLYSKSQVASKSWHRIVKSIFNIIVKMYEFCWINGLYRLEDWTSEITSTLPQLLGVGGWSLALKLKERTTTLISNNPAEEAKKYIKKSRTSEGIPHVTGALTEAIGSNLYGMELHDARVVLSEALGYSVEGRRAEFAKPSLSAAEFGMTVSVLRGVLSWINILSGPAEKSSLHYVPFPDLWASGAAYGRADGRTKNITPSDIAKILGEGIYWAENRGPLVILVLKDIVEGLEYEIDEDRSPTYEKALESLKKSPHLVQLNELLGSDIDELRSSRSVNRDRTLENVISKLAAGCFCIIALLNARRKDEIIHRKIGLMQNSMELVDESLDLYRCWFYVEKTLKKHVVMFIGRATHRAISLLQELQRLTIRLASTISGRQDFTDEAERSLFQLPLFSFNTGDRVSRRWYNPASAGSRSFLIDALGSESSAAKINPHMFRRGYGVLFIYRFEGPLLALMQKYRHFDPKHTITYVSDLGLRSGEPSLRDFSQLTREQIVESWSEIQDIEVEIADASKERIAQIVTEIYENRGVSLSGFDRLIQRICQRLALKIEFKSMSTFSKCRAVADYLVSRGHEVRPYWHGNCCAPSTGLTKKSPCNPGSSGAKRENADPVTCSSCHYHHLVSDHLSSIEGYCNELERKLAHEDCLVIDRLRLIPVLENTKRVVLLYKERLQNSG